MSKIQEFIRAIPKTDLHLHLDGSLRLPTLIELAQSDSVSLPSMTEEGLLELVFKEQYQDLPDYLSGFAYTVAVLQKAEHLERVSYELAIDNLEEGVRYIEVRFAPQLHIHDGLSIKEVLEAVDRGLKRARDEHNASGLVAAGEDLPFEYGIIVCALRWFLPVFSQYYDKLFSVMSYAREQQVFAAASTALARAAIALAKDGIPIVAIDLAGAEAGNPAEDHRHAFSIAHSHFLRKTVHAGEAYGPESIFQAITDCHANRIGHGTHLFAADMVKNPQIQDPEYYVAQLVNYIASERIPIEVNLTSNLQTLPEIKSVADHPLKQMIEHQLSATICTDNRLVSRTTVCKELELASEHLELGTKELKRLVIAGFKGAFYPHPYGEKRAYVRRAIDRVNAIETEIFG